MPVYPITLPSTRQLSERLRLSRTQVSHQSRFTGKTQIVDNYSQWQLSINLSRMSHVEAEQWAAALDSLRGQIGTFLWEPWQSQQSALSGRSLSFNFNVYGTIATIGGWAANSASQLRAGQFCQIGTQLLRIIAAPANADANGRCQIEVEPYIRATHNAGTAVNFTSPKGLFRLSDQEPSYQIDVNRLPEFTTIEAVEAL